MQTLGQFEFIEEKDILTCRYVCGLIPNAELFEPLGTAIIKSFKIRRKDFARYLDSDIKRLQQFIAERLIRVACFDVDLTLYDVQTWYKTDKPPQIRNRETITQTLTSLKNLPMWRSIVITNNYLYNISKRVAQGNYDLDELLGDVFFDKKYTRTDMTGLNKKNLLSSEANNDYTWIREGNKAYPLRCYYTELCRHTAINRNGFLNLQDKTMVIDVVSAFLVDDSPDNLKDIQQHGVFPIEASYTETERDAKQHVVCVQQDDDANYVREIDRIIVEGIPFKQLIEAPAPLYQQQQQPRLDDDQAAIGCCCFRLFAKKQPDQVPLVKAQQSDTTINFQDL